MALDGAGAATAVVLVKASAIAAVNRGDIEYFGVRQGLLDAGAERVFVVFGFDDGDGDVGLVTEDVVGSFARTAAGAVAFDLDAAIGEGDFFKYLAVPLPASALQSWMDVFAADVSF